MEQKDLLAPGFSTVPRYSFLQIGEILVAKRQNHKMDPPTLCNTISTIYWLKKKVMQLQAYKWGLRGIP